MSGYFVLRAMLTGFCFYSIVLPTRATAADDDSPKPPERGVSAVDPKIVAGNLVSVADQQRLGLVTLSNDCSGTLINRSWVLTADHCVGGGVRGGPDQPFANVQITAAWSPVTVVTPTRYVRYFATDGVDVALIFLGHKDFNQSNLQSLTNGQMPNGTAVTTFGRGIFAYARMSGTTAIPASRRPLPQRRVECEQFGQ